MEISDLFFISKDAFIKILLNLLLMQNSKAFLMIFFMLTIFSCAQKKYNVIGISKRLIYPTHNDYFKVVTLDNSNCDLNCKSKFSYVAVNNTSFKVGATFEKKYHFCLKDSSVNQDYILNPGDSILIACGCGESVQSNDKDWNMDLTVISIKKIE